MESVFIEGEGTTDRPERRLEGLINRLHSINENASGIANRLRDMRRRLMGMDDNNEPADPTLKEAVQSEVDDLRIGLDNLERKLAEIENHVGNLEGV